MLRFAIGFFVGLSCAGWVAAHPAAAHAIAAGEHLAGELLLNIAHRLVHWPSLRAARIAVGQHA